MKTIPCPICQCSRALLLDVAKRTNDQLIYRHRCSNCNAHTMWSVNEVASLSMWNHGDVEK